MAEPRIWTELLTYGIGVALSPIHIVLLLLLLGASPLRRGGLFVGGWLLTSALAVIGLLTLGHGLLLDMTHGSHHRTGLDLIGGGALIALGGRELIRGLLDDGAAPQQQQQQQNDVDGRQRHAKPVGQQFRPDPGFRHGPCSELAAHSCRIRAARPMLTPKLTTPSRALQKALSLVSRKLLKTCQGLYSPVVPSGSM